jgi:hypothetical protein
LTPVEFTFFVDFDCGTAASSVGLQLESEAVVCVLAPIAPKLGVSSAVDSSVMHSLGLISKAEHTASFNKLILFQCVDYSGKTMR